MIRRNIRLRKEYLYSKSQEAKELENQKKRVQVKKAIDNDQKIPNEWKKEKDQVIHQAALGDDHTIAARTAIDDEYEGAKFRDPKVLVTALPVLQVIPVEANRLKLHGIFLTPVYVTQNRRNAMGVGWVFDAHLATDLHESVWSLQGVALMLNSTSL